MNNAKERNQQANAGHTQCESRRDDERAEADKSEYEYKGKRFRIVEDDEVSAMALTMILEDEGAQAERAENGEIGVQMLVDKPAGYYDAILMDIQMPVMDGRQATRAIRPLPRDDAASIPIVAVSSDTSGEDVKASLEAGMNAHLPKSVNLTTLGQTLSKLNG